MKTRFRSLALFLLTAVFVPYTPSIATVLRSSQQQPGQPNVLPSNTKIAFSPGELREKAQKITVRVTSANNGGSGVLVARKNNTYLVLTNQHVARRDRQFQIKTADGKQYAATLLPKTNIDPKYDVALLQFTSTTDYQLANLNNDNRPIGQARTIYSAGYPFDSEQLRFSGGAVSQLSDLPLEDGTQIGYAINTDEKGVRQGMSGGPIIDLNGVVIGINTISVAPLLPSYKYIDGSKPTPQKSAQYQQANWGVPIYNFLTQLNPNILYAYDFPKVPHQVTPTGDYLTNLNQKTRQQTVRFEAGGQSGSGVIVAKEGNTYSVLTAKHVVQNENSKQLHADIKTITFDQESHQIDLNNITVSAGEDLAIVKFTTTANYPVAQLSSVKPRPDDVLFVGGYPGREKINSPLWQWQLNPGTSYGQDRGQDNTRNDKSFDEGYNLIYTNITYGGMSGGPIFDAEGRVIGLHGRSEEGDTAPELMLGNSLGISIKSFIGMAARLKVNPQLLKIIKEVPRYLTASELKTVADVRDSLPEPDNKQDGSQWIRYGGQLNRTKQYTKAIAAFDRAIAIDPNTYRLTGTYGKAKAYSGLARLDGKSAVSLADPKVENVNRALALYSTAIASIPQTDRQRYYFLWKGQADKLFNLSRYDAALQSNQQAIDLNPNDRRLDLDRAFYYRYKKDYNRAISIYDRLIQQQPGVATFYAGKGVVKGNMADYQHTLGDSTEATLTYNSTISDYNIALKLDPEYTEAYYYRSDSKVYIKDFKGALADINLAISYDPRNDFYYERRGYIKQRSGDLRSSIDDYTTAISLVPRGIYYSLRGSTKRDLKDYQGAIIDHNIAVKLDPKNSLTYINRGIARHGLKDYQGAIADYNIAIRLDPKSFLVYNIRGHAKNDLEDYQGAIADFTQAITISPKDDSIYSSRGIAKYKLKDYKGAISDYTQAISLNPKDYLTYNLRGDIKIKLKDYQGAIADFTQSIVLNPKDASAYSGRGNAKSQLKDYKSAISDFTQAIALNPKYINTYNLRGISKYFLEDYLGAIADFNESIALNPRGLDVYIQRGFAKNNLKDYQGAIADFSQAIAIEPKKKSAYSSRGTAKYVLKDYQGAIADHTQVILLDPKNALAYGSRGEAKNALKDYQGAIADFDRWIALDPKNDSAYDERSIAKYQIGDYKGAIADTERMLELNPKNDNAYSNRGFYKFLTNNNQGALADWEQAIKLNPKNSYAYANRGFYQVMLGNDQRGLVDVEKSIQLNPELANSYAVRGLIRANSGDRVGAVSDYKQALKINPKLIDDLTKDAKQLQRSNNLAAYQKYQQIIQGLTVQK